MTIDELPGIRERIKEPPCEFTQHVWDTVVYNGITLWVLCRACGRTPLETLGDLPIWSSPSSRQDSETQTG